MNTATNDGELGEASLVKLYMDLTGASEASARGVYMFVCSQCEIERPNPNGLEKWRTGMPASQRAISNIALERSERDEEFGTGIFGAGSLALP